MKTVRVNDGIIVEVLTAHSGFSLSECFHPDILAQTIQVDDDVQVGDPIPVVEAPVIEEAPVVEETPLVEETPVTEEAPPEAPAEGV